MYKILAKTLFIGKKIIYLPSCHSTNDVATELVKTNDYQNGMIVITDNQLQGKGQQGNSWFSAPNLNLTFSIILTPNFLQVKDQFQLNMAISLGIQKFLKRFDSEFLIKWPNDIYHNNKKIGGILIQNSLKGIQMTTSIIGIGLNVNQEAFSINTANSLKNITKSEFSLPVLLEELSHHIEIQYLKVKNGAIETIKNEYLHHLLGFQENRLYRANKIFNGKISGISSTGKLQIKAAEKEYEFDLKEVEFIF